MTQQNNITNVNEYKLAFPERYDKLVKKHESGEGNMKLFANADEGITASYYKAALKKNPNLDFIEFSRAFNPAGRFSSLDNYRNYYKSNQNVYEKSDGRLADRMYNHLTVTGDDNPVYGGNVKLKDYKDFIFQQAPRFQASGSRKEGMVTQVPKPYTKNELTEFTGSLVGDEDMALPTDNMRAIQALSFKREEALKYLQEYLYNQYQAAGGTIGPEDKEIVEQNKFLRKNIKTGELEFYNPKANKYQLMNSQGLDVGDILSLSGDSVKLLTETVGGVGGYLFGKGVGLTTAALTGPASFVAAPVLGGLGGVYGGYKGSYYGSLVGEITKAAIGNVFFPGLNPDTSTKEGIDQIIKDPNVMKDAELAGYFGAAGIAAEGVVRAAVKALQTGKLLTKKDFKNLATSAEEAQLIADEINGKLTDSKLLAKGEPKQFFFGVAEATQDPETMLFLNALIDSDPLVKQKISAMDKTQQRLLSAYFDEAGSSFNYANLSGKPGSDPTSVINKIKEILYIRKNTDIGRFRDDVLKKSQKNLDDAIKELPNQGKILDKDISGSFIRTAVGDAQKALDDEFTPLFEGVMELAKDQQVSVAPIKKVLNEITKRQEETAFKNFLPVEKFFTLKDGAKLDGKYLIQTMQDLKAFDRKMRTGAIAADASEANVQRLIGAIQESFATGSKGNKTIYQKLRNLNTDYYNRKKALNNTLGDLVAVKNGRVKIQDSDLFETSFTARTGGYKERIDEVYEVLKNNADHMNAYKQNILNFYRREVIKPDGTVDIKKHQQFVSQTDKGGYGYGLRKFFGDEFNEIKKVGQLQKRVEKETLQLENLKKELAEQTAGKVQDLSPNSIINAMFDAQDPKMVSQVMDLLDQNPSVKNKFKTVLADRIKDGITDTKGNFNLIEFDKFFKPNKKNSTYNAFKIAFRDDKNYIDAIDTIHKAVTIMARRGEGATRKESLSSQWMMHLLRVRVGMFTPEGRAMTAAIRLSEKANQKSFANIITNPEATKKIAQLAKMPIPKGLTDDFSINQFAKRNKLYNQVVTQLLGDLTGFGSEDTDIQDPFVVLDKDNKKPVLPKPRLKEQMDMSLDTTQPAVNLFAGTLDMPLIDNQPPPQEPVVAQAPPRASGIGALNPQAQAANFAGLFPEDNLGQAIAQRGNKIG